MRAVSISRVVEQPRIPFEYEARIADDLHAARTRLDAALASARLSGAEHRLRIDAIDSYMKERAGPFIRGNLYDVWTMRHH